MTRVLIPRERRNREIIYWLTKNVGPTVDSSQAYDQYGEGWALSTYRDQHNNLYWQINFEDSTHANLFKMKWT